MPVTSVNANAAPLVTSLKKEIDRSAALVARARTGIERMEIISTLEHS